LPPRPNCIPHPHIAVTGFGPPAAAPVNDALLAAVRDATVAALIAALNAAAAEGRL
jgi:hypothetical protein